MRAADPSLVVLAAGSGTRFGGAKQLAPVGPGGTSIMDVLIERAASVGFGRVVVIVAPGMEDTVRAHIDEHRSARGRQTIDIVAQPMPPGWAKPPGTAHALLAACAFVDDRAFGVVNADDLYPLDAFALQAGHLRDAPESEHVMVAFRVGRTLVGARPVSRALIDVDERGRLGSIREGTVTTTDEGLTFEDRSGRRAPLAPDRIVSMNMWGFRPSVFTLVTDAVDAFLASGADGEIYLPEVVARMVAAGTTVRVQVCESACFGLTHRDDLAAVRASLS